MQTFVEIGSAVRKIFPDKKNKQIESLSRVAQLTLGARLINEQYFLVRKLGLGRRVVGLSLVITEVSRGGGMIW